MPKQHGLYSAHRSGQAGESIALNYLQKKGLNLVTANYHCRSGEIDLIMQSKQTIIFVEVRSRSSSGYADPAETITAFKQAKIIRTAKHYLMYNAHLNEFYCRFDVVTITGKAGMKYKIDWLKGAFDAF